MLEREIGRGGMATVYLARDLKHDRSVALKVLAPRSRRALGARAVPPRDQHRRATPASAYPEVHDSGEAAGRLWFTMPYVAGESLRDRIPASGSSRSPTPCASRARRRPRLDHAHRHGVVHRDIKPENILLTRRHALVADFGIAGARAPGRRRRDAHATRGSRVGTPAYMSPEQASGDRELDGADRSLLPWLRAVRDAGRASRRYVGATAQAVIAKRLTEPVPRLGTLRQVPPGVEHAVTTALARSPADRFRTAGELASALSAAGAPPPAGPLRRLFGRRSRTIAVLAASLASGAGVAWLLLTRPWEPRPGANSVAVLPFANLSPGPGNEYFGDGIAEELTTALGRVEGPKSQPGRPRSPSKERILTCRRW